MKLVETIEVDARELNFCNNLMLGGEEDPETEENPYTFTADFGNGIEVDIKVVNASPPYIDAVIFNRGSEVYCLEPCFERLEGEYKFEIDSHEYVVVLK